MSTLSLEIGSSTLPTIKFLPRRLDDTDRYFSICGKTTPSVRRHTGRGSFMLWVHEITVINYYKYHRKAHSDICRGKIFILLVLSPRSMNEVQKKYKLYLILYTPPDIGLL